MTKTRSPYSKVLNARQTPQTLPVPGKNQAQNNAGGFVWKITPWQQLRRFLILGSEKGTYYVGEQELTVANAKIVQQCLDLDHTRTIQMIVEVSHGGLAPKNTPAIFALAIAISHQEEGVRRAAADALTGVIRIGTHMLQFAGMVNGMRGWGKLLRNAVTNWYYTKRDLPFQLAKYQNRDGWTHRDVMRKLHPAPHVDPKIANAMGWAAGRIKKDKDGVWYADVKKPGDLNLVRVEGPDLAPNMPDIIKGMEEAKVPENENDLAQIIATYGLTREMVPTEYLKSPVVWGALVPNLGLTALIRNLGNLSKSGWLIDTAEAENMSQVVNALGDRERIQKERVHPLAILLALSTYATGKGFRGHGEWTVSQTVVDALNNAFYLAFQNVEPIGKNIYIGLDVSSSMSGSQIAGTNLTAAECAAALAMLYVRTEESVQVRAFCGTLKSLPLTKGMNLKEVMNQTSRLSFGSTDCALPMIDAINRKLDVDLFLVMTDSETWAGNEHPFQALQRYRATMGKPEAKLVVLGMTATEFSIANPDDPGMLDVVGMDASVPELIRAFALGQI